MLGASLLPGERSLVSVEGLGDLMTPCSGFPFSKTWLEMPPSLSQRTRLGEDDALRGSREHRLPLWDGATCSSSEKPKENHFTSHSSTVNNLFS